MTPEGRAALRSKIVRARERSHAYIYLTPDDAEALLSALEEAEARVSFYEECAKAPLMRTVMEQRDKAESESAALRAQVEGMRSALEDAAKSLEWIAARKRDVAHEESFGDQVAEIRAYANSRARAARAALSGGEGAK